MITYSELNKLLSYEPDTGVFTWLVDGGSRRRSGNVAGQSDIIVNKYRSVRIGSKFYQLHRVAWCLKTGEWPEKQIDHKNGVKGDNRWDNLRLATNGQNTFNTPVSKRNTSGCKGVCWMKKEKTWRANIMVNGVVHKLGYHKSLDDAVAARRAAEARLLGDWIIR